MRLSCTAEPRHALPNRRRYRRHLHRCRRRRTGRRAHCWQGAIHALAQRRRRQGGARRRGPHHGPLLRGADRSHGRADLRHDLGDQRDRHRYHRQDGAAGDRGFSRHPGLPPGRQVAPLRAPYRPAQALCAAPAHGRDPGAGDGRGRGGSGARRRRGACGARPAGAAGGGGDRRLPALVDQESGARGAAGRPDRGDDAGGSLHALAPPQPDPARISACIFGRDRRLAEAPHAAPPARPQRRPRRRGLRPASSWSARSQAA